MLNNTKKLTPKLLSMKLSTLSEPKPIKTILIKLPHFAEMSQIKKT